MSSNSENDDPPAASAALWRRAAGRIRRALDDVRASGALPAGFDWRSYLDRNPDLAAAGIGDEASAVRHWRVHGGAEGRSFSSPASPEVAPPGFDWRWYVAAYTDLAPAGITDEASAIWHWRQHGRRDGRRFAPRHPHSFDWTSYVDHFEVDRVPAVGESTRRLVCPSVDSIFLRAWGDLVCWDDAGSDHVLQAWDPAADYAEVFLNGPYEEIRRKLEGSTLPRPEECEKCLLLRVMPSGRGAPWDRGFVRMLRVEPSYRCSLDCPGCVPLSIRRLHQKAFQLDPNILDRILADLTARGLEVDAVDFQGHGEPLLNPRLWEMGRRSRARLPDAWISVTTNAQGVFRPEMAASGFDEFICSIDGTDQANYAPYRVHGDFGLSWRFMVDLVEASARSDRRYRVVWKYVLFEHNSSPETLLAAQRMALEAGVSELVLVLSRNGPSARHIRVPSDIPRLSPGPPVSFRFHEPAIDDLESRWEEALRLEAQGRGEEVAAIADSIRKNVERFFPAGSEIPERHRRLLDELERRSPGPRR